jgi:predicted DCC family thiol-disulfide oxidoreductase YuxK
MQNHPDHVAGSRMSRRRLASPADRERLFMLYDGTCALCRAEAAKLALKLTDLEWNALKRAEDQRRRRNEDAAA